MACKDGLTSDVKTCIIDSLFLFVTEKDQMDVCLQYIDKEFYFNWKDASQTKVANISYNNRAVIVREMYSRSEYMFEEKNRYLEKILGNN